MKSNTKKTVILTLIMAFVMALTTAIAVLVKNNIAANKVASSKMDVTKIAKLYDDETRAKEDLETMKEAGLLDENGKMVSLDLRESGNSVGLSYLAERIASGEEVGVITVNGKETTPEQVVQMAQVNAAIEIAELLDQEIEVTDQHVKNLESFLMGIQSGSIDLENVVKTGALKLNSENTLFGMDAEEQVDYTLPENTPSKLTLSADGKKYVAPYISGSTYIKNYSFELEDLNGENKDSYSVGYEGARPQANTATTENNPKVDNFDFSRVVVGVDDNRFAPTVTVILPLKEDDAVQNWIIEEYEHHRLNDISKNGVGVQMDLPGYGKVNLKYYFNYMYFEYDNSEQIRMPVFLVEDEATGRYTAVATRFTAPMNTNSSPRLDTLSLHVDRKGNSIGPIKVTYEEMVWYDNGGGDYGWMWPGREKEYPYLAPWSEISIDANGNYYWDMSAYAAKCGVPYTRNLEPWDAWSRWVESAPAIPGRGIRYFVPPVIRITSDEYQVREEGSYEQAENGFIQLKNPENEEFPYVYPKDVNHPERQYDMELMVSEELYEVYAKAATKANRYVYFDCLSDELLFENDPVYPWVVIREDGFGNYAKAGNDGINNSTSTLRMKVTLEQPGTLFFEFGYKTDEFAHDQVLFTLDGETKLQSDGEGDYGSTYPQSFELSAGTHTLVWSYSKDWDDRFDAIGGYQGPRIKNLSIQTEGSITQPDDTKSYSFAKMQEGVDTLRAALRVSDRRNFSRKADGYVFQKVEWTSASANKNYVEQDSSENGTPIVTILSKRQTPLEDLFSNNNIVGCTVTPLAGNAFKLNVPIYLRVGEADPYLSVPKYSRFREGVTGTDVDILFSSNLAQHNKLKGGTKYQVELYKIAGVDKNNLDVLPASAELVEIENWGEFTASANNAITHISIPGAALKEAGYYAVKISADFSDGLNQQTFTTLSYLNLKIAPVKVEFDRLSSDYFSKDNFPAIRYQLTSAAEGVEVKYTVQGSGENTIQEFTAENGVIPFTPDDFEGLKKAYTFTIYARNEAEQPWSTDSMLITVYNSDVLEFLVKDVALGKIGGSTGGKVGDGTFAPGENLNIDNNPKVEELVDETGEGEGYKISDYDFDELRSDLGLQRVISINYGLGVWGTISDRMQWSYREKNGYTSNDVTLNNEEYGVYRDLRDYSYNSYIPTTDFLIVATENKSEDAPVTITATHAATGMQKSIQVTVNTLKDKLYLFRFLPKTTTYVTYTNGKGVKRELHSNENGELAVYEPDSIAGDIITMSTYEGETYAGTIQNKSLVSGEKNIVKLQIYPCNDLTLVPISNLTLTILKPDGKPFEGEAVLRAGIYKGGEYCPNYGVRTGKDEGDQILRDDIVVQAKDGKVTLYYDPTQLTADNGLNRGLRYVYEYRVEGYQPGYAIVNPFSQNTSDFIISLQAVRGNSSTPQITRQEYLQYLNGTKPNSYSRSVIDSKENIGISPNYSKAVLTTDLALPGESVGVGESVNGEKGYSTYEGERVVKFAFYTAGGKKLTGQSDLSSESVKATQITKLSQLDSATYYVFPFSAVPMMRSIYVMTDADMRADGIDDLNKMPTARVKATFTRGKIVVASLNMPFGVTNVSNQPNLADADNGAAAVGKEVRDDIRETADIGAIFRSINVNDMIRKGFLFLGNLSGVGGDNFMNLMILPTQDPSTFRIIAFVGANARPNTNQDGLSVNFNSDDLAEDMNKLVKDMEESGNKKDSDSNGEGSMKFNFYGTIILEAHAGVKDGNWDIDFRGGNVGTNVSGKYEWGQTFFCGPYPAFISFETGFHADLEVAFGNKGAARAMLLDAAMGVSVEAFAGLGFDLSIVALQLGIYGEIGADVNFLMLTPSDAAVSTGTKLTISGEIGIKLKIKILFISYSEKFASTGFNWTKKWNKYDQIKNYWTNQGYGQLFGTTRSGRAYQMLLFADGSAMVAVEGGAELESRDYLELEDRVWSSGSGAKRMLRASSAMTDVQTNAYPYSNPEFTDDGEMFLYISDNDNAKEAEGVVSYAVKNGEGYDNLGRVDASEDNVLADLDVVASGTKENAFAAWVKQEEMPQLEKGTAITNDDLGMMFNATEVYAARFDGSAWTTEKLTDNFVADMSPAVASYENRAIVAWRSMNASTMTPDGSDITAVFDVENSINYRMYNGTQWTEAQVAYNGSAGTVNAISAAMLSGGTAILTYTVRTGEDVSTTETFYTVISADGNLITTGRLTRDDFIDANAQATAVNDGEGYFVLAWYSEHDASEGASFDYDEEGNPVEKKVVAHDIRLARINKNGSYEIDFPESIGGTGSSSITSSFRLSTPAKNEKLGSVAIVWSHRKENSEASDAGKYLLSAVRFFEEGDFVGVTAETDLAETAKNYTIDHYDVYTDEEGIVHAVILGSDYDSIKGIEVFDSIDLDAAAGNTVTSNTSAPSNLDILDGEAISSIKLAKGTFPKISATVSVQTNISDVKPGFTTPVQFTITNTGTEKLLSVKATVGKESKEFTVNLLPSASASVMMYYPIPLGAVSDAEYVLTSGGEELSSGTISFNRPDVGITGVKILEEVSGTREVQVTLTNASDIPLSGSGKRVKLAFYQDPFYDNLIGEEIEIDSSEFVAIDEGSFSIVRAIKVTSIAALDETGEIPAEGITLYVRAWVEETEEPNLYNNSGYVTIKSLVTRNLGAKLTTDNLLEEENGAYRVFAYIRNNSIQEVEVGVPVAVLLDDKGNILARKNMAESLTIGAEVEQTLEVTFTAEEFVGEPVSSEIRYLTEVSFDVNGGSGSFDKVTTDLDGHILLPETAPAPFAAEPPVFFRGWFTRPTGGEKVTEETCFQVKTTIYAQYTAHEHVFSYTLSASGDTVIAECVSTVEDDCTLEAHARKATLQIVAPERAKDGYGNQEARLVGDKDVLGTPEIRYYAVAQNGEKGELFVVAPSKPGKYVAEFTLIDGETSLTAFVNYTIPEVEGVEDAVAEIPEFVKITDPAALENFESCSFAQALAWIRENQEMLNEDEMTSKYILAGKRTIKKPEDYPEEMEWPYEENVEYAFGYVVFAHTVQLMEPMPIEELASLMAGRYNDIYVMGSESTQKILNATFEEVNSTEEFSSLKPCSDVDTLVWILAKIKEKNARGMFVYESFISEWDEQLNYRYIMLLGNSLEMREGSAEGILEMKEWEGFPVYLSVEGVMNPNLKFTVVYDNNGGAGSVASGNFYVKSTISVASGDALTKPNLVFDGWNTKADGTGDAYKPGDEFVVLANTTLYAQWKHVHDWNVTFDEDEKSFTAICSIPDCPCSTLTLTPAPVDKMYDGENGAPYVRSEEWTKENGLPMPEIEFFVGGEKVDEGKNVGTYTAIVSLISHSVEVGEYSITKRPILVTADDIEKHENEEDPELTVTYAPVGASLRFENDETYPWQKVVEGDKVYAQSGNGGKSNSTSTLTMRVNLEKAGTLSFEYNYGTERNSDYARFYVDDYEKFSFSEVGEWSTYTYDLSAGEHTLTWSYSKDGSVDKNGDFFAVENIVIETEGELTQPEKEDKTVLLSALSETLCVQNDDNYPWTENTVGDRTFVQSGNGGIDRSSSTLTMRVNLEKAGTLSFEYNYGTEGYCDWCTFLVDGIEVFKESDVKDWTSYSYELTAGEHKLTWIYSKDGSTSENGDFFALDNLTITTEGEVSQGDPDVWLISALNKFVGGIVEGESLNYTISRVQGEAMGEYAITLKMGENPNYDIQNVSGGKFTILESLGEKQTIEASDISATYGDTGVKIVASVTTGDGALSYKVKSGDCVTVDEKGNVTIVKAGTAVITVSAAKTEVYAPANVNVTVTVNPKQMSVSAANVNATVNGNSFGIEVTVTDPAEGYTVKYGTEEGTYTLTESPTISEEGTLTVYYQVTAENYVTFTGSATITLVNHAHELTYTVGTGENANTITATCSAEDCPLENRTATLTISAPNGKIVYDGSAHSALITDENGIQGTAKVLYAAKGENGVYGEASETAPVNAGVYKASISLGEGEKQVTASVEFEIQNAALTNVSVSQNGTLTYNANAQTPQVNASATAVNHQTVTFTYSLTENGEFGGMPTFTAVADSGTVYYKATAPNHNEASGSFTITMNKANVSAPAAPTLSSATANRILLTAVEGCEYSRDGETWQESATFSGLIKNTQYSFYQRLKETANTFASPSSVAASISTTDHDHAWEGFTANGASISATCLNTDGGHSGKTSATMSIAAPTRTIYGGEGSAEAIVTNAIEGVEIPTIVYTQGETILTSAPTNVGTYTASITLGEGETAVTASVTYTIAKAALTVTANNKTISYGDAPTNNGVTYSGFASGENASVLSGTLEFEYSYAQFGGVGTYTLTPKGLTSGNYEITFVSGNLKVNPKAITVTIQSATSVYGEEQAALTATTAEGAIVNGDTGVYTLACEVTKTSGVGSYNILGTDASENYAVTFEGGENAYRVTARTIGIAWEHTNDLVYNKTAQKPTATATNLVNGDTVSLTISGEGTFVGEDYSASAAFSAAQANYALPEEVSTTFSILPKPITVTIESKSSVYGEEQAALTATTAEGAIEEGDTGVYTLSSEVTSASGVGSYDILGTDTSGNYLVTFEGGENAYQVTAREIEIVWTHTSDLVYNKTEQKPTATATNLVNGDTVSLTVTGEQVNAGEGYEASAAFATVQANYILPEVVSTTFSIAEKPITVTIQSATSVYGDEQAALTATTAEGAIVNGDTGVYTLACEVTKESGVGTYAVVGTDASGNYLVTFEGGENAYKVTAREIEIVWTHTDDLAYNKKAQQPTATASNLVNGDEVSLTVTGEGTFVGEEYSASAAFTTEQANYILPEEVSTTFSILPKPITVTIEKKSSVYGEKQVELSATTEEGAIEEGDEEVYELTSEVNERTPVGTYAIQGETLNENYEITFENAENGYQVTARTIGIVWSGMEGLVYNKTAQKPGAMATNLVNGDRVSLTVTGEEVNAGEGYEAIAAFATAQRNYALPSNASTTFSIAEKPIMVTIQSATSVYKEAQATLTATTEEGAIEEGDELPYALTTAVNETSNVGLYDILGTDASENYLVTFAGGEKAYQVTKRPIIATAEEKSILCGETLPEYTFSASEEIAAEVRNELKEKTSFACEADSLVPGKYEIIFSFADGVTGETALKNYTVTLENGTLYILTKALTDNSSEESSAVEILLEDSKEAFDYKISVSVEVKTTEETTESSIDYEKVSAQYVDSRSEISKVYSIKLLRSEVVNGVETLTEIQPSDIEEGLKLIIKMEIPDYLTGRNFRILHIHSEEDIEYIAEENIEISDGYAYVTIDRLSDFAFVHLKDSEEINHKGFCLGWLGIILDALVGVLFAVAVIKRGKKLLNLIGLGSAGAVTVFTFIVLISHLCYASIVGMSLAAILLIAFLVFFLLQRKGRKEKATEEDIEDDE